MNSFNQSRELDKLAPALVAAQAAGLIAIEREANKQVNSQYADFVAIVTAIRPILAANGLAFSQQIGVVRKEGEEYLIGLRTILLHESGQFISDYGEFIIAFIVSRAGGGLSKTWASASAVTYLRRYCLCAILGVVTGGDDDAQRFAEMHSVAPKAGTAPPASAATGDFAPYVGGVWKDSLGPDGRPLAQYASTELKKLIADSIAGGEDSDPLKASIFDHVESRLRQLGEHLVPALEDRGWKGVPDPSEWTLKEFREAGMLLLTPKKAEGGAMEV